MAKATREKVCEYASMPVHGTLSRKLRKGLSIQIGEGKVYEQATLFLGEEFLRITERNGKLQINTYYDWEKNTNVRTVGETED